MASGTLLMARAQLFFTAGSTLLIAPGFSSRAFVSFYAAPVPITPFFAFAAPFERPAALPL